VTEKNSADYGNIPPEVLAAGDELAAGLKKNLQSLAEAEVSLWVARDDMASEQEMGDFLCGLVRMLKPNLVVETGCYMGDSTVRMEEAIDRNQCGVLVACDVDAGHVAEVNGKLLMHRARCELSKGVDLPDLADADLVFSDSGDSDTRIAEYNRCKSGCVFVVHDTQWAALAEFVRKQGGIVFSAGRGFGVIQKP
jgi:predicted O-methyltransferase YrrM